MRSLRYRVASALLCTLGLTLAACGNDSPTADSTAAPASSAAASPTTHAATKPAEASVAPSSSQPRLDAPSKVTLGASGRWAFISNSGVLAARGQGYFDEIAAKFGTKFEFADVGAGAETLAALEGGTIDGGAMTMGALASANAKDRPYVGVVEIFHGIITPMVGAKKHEAAFGTNLSAYADSVWGYTSPGTSTAIQTEFAATQAGLDFKSLKQVAFGEVAAAQPGMEQGRLDIVCVDALTAARMVSAGVAYVVNTKGPDIYGNPLAFKPEFIEKYPDLVQAIVDAILRGLSDVQASIDDPAHVLSLFPDDVQKSMAGSFELAFQLSSDLFSGDGSFTDSSLGTTRDYLTKNGLVPEDRIDRASIGWDNEFVKRSTYFSAKT